MDYCNFTPHMWFTYNFKFETWCDHARILVQWNFVNPDAVNPDASLSGRYFWEQTVWKSIKMMWFIYPDDFAGNQSVRINEARLYDNFTECENQSSLYFDPAAEKFRTLIHIWIHIWKLHTSSCLIYFSPENFQGWNKNSSLHGGCCLRHVSSMK
jgi:hypothetical protein